MLQAKDIDLFNLIQEEYRDMIKINYIVAVSLLGLVCILSLPETSHAIPAFSRAHKVECTTCHTIYPELNEYGEAFLKNSYVYFSHDKKKDASASAPKAAKPAAKKVVTDAGTEVKGDGDSAKLAALKAGALSGSTSSESQPAATEPEAVEQNHDAKPTTEKAEGILLSGIPEQLPISFTGSINYGYDTSQVNEVDFAARSIKMHAGGNFREKFGFFATYVAYSEQPPTGTYNTSTTASNNKTDLNEFLLSWRHVLDSPVNLRIGRMQPKMGLWKTNNKLSATNNYLPYSYTVGKSSLFKIEQPQDTLELNSIVANRLYVAGGIVNRKGQNTKEGYGHLSYKFGGADFLTNEPEIDLNKEESILDYLTLTVGAYGYYGKNGTSNSNDPKNTYYRVGSDAELMYKIYRLRLLGNYGNDDNATPTTLNSWTNVISKAGAVEGEVTLLTNLIAAGRFEYLQQESNSQARFANNYVRRYVSTLGYSPLQNVKFAVEYKYEILPSTINKVGVLGATIAF